MSKVTDITSLYKTFKSDREKQEFCEMQFQISVAFQKQIKQLEEENKHLKELLSASVPLVGEVMKVIVTPEEHLIDRQLGLLEEQHRTGQSLSLEDTKKLDLLIKNKRLLKEQTTTIQGESKPVKSSLSKKELLQIAATKKDDENV